MPRACPVECSRLQLHSSEREGSTGQARGIQPHLLLVLYSREREGSTGQARGIQTHLLLVLYSREREGSTGQARRIQPLVILVLYSREREAPRDKPVASKQYYSPIILTSTRFLRPPSNSP